MLGGRVEDVADPDVLQVGHVADGLAVADDDAVEDLELGGQFEAAARSPTLSQSTRSDLLSSKSVADLNPDRCKISVCFKRRYFT